MYQIHQFSPNYITTFPVASFQSIRLADLTFKNLAWLYPDKYKFVQPTDPNYDHDFIASFKLVNCDYCATVAEFLSPRDAKLAKSILICYTGSPAKIIYNGREVLD